MKYDTKKEKYPFVLSIIIILFLFVGSYQGVVPSYSDEILLILLTSYIIVKALMDNGYIVINKKLFSALFIYISIGVVVSIMRLYYDSNALEMLISEIFNNLKPLIVLILFSTLLISDKYQKFLISAFVIINIPSIIISLNQYRNRDIGYAMGLKMRDGVGRIMGYAGHPIAYGFILVILIMIMFSWKEYPLKKKWQRIALDVGIVFFCVLLYFTQSRYPQFLLISIGMLLYILKKKSSTKTLILFVIAIGLVFLLAFASPLINEFFNGEANTVRFVGIQTGIKTLTHFPLFGCGIGTFGTASSFEVNSYVYKLFDISINTTRTANLSSGCFFETGFFQKIVENGIIGTMCYYYIFVRYIILALRKKSYLNLAIILLITLNSIMNPLYRLPGIFIVGICMSNLNWKVGTQTERG